jgi:hypothetical protein
MAIKQFTIAAAFPLLWILFSCSVEMTNNGSGTNTGNALVMGKVVDSRGKPAPQTQVVLLASTYNRVTDPAGSVQKPVTTDSAGNYVLVAPDSGIFNIQAIRAVDGTRLLICNIHVALDPVSVHTDTLRNPGSIRVALPGTGDVVNGYLYIPGTTIFSLLNSGSGYTVLDSVPANVAVTVSYAVRGDTAKPPTVIAGGISVAPGGIMNVEFVGWAFSRKLVLNTAGSGANVAGDAVNFPVLVRLTRNNFNFNEAKSGGEDIRFAKSDGSPLPYEIERWDASQSLAEIWVKTDTVHGNDSTQAITMYWGNPGAASASNSAAVFDTTYGFAGVWHMAQAGNATAYDATANHFDGTPVGMSSASAVAGNIGIGQQFNGSSTGITMQNTAYGKLDFYGNGDYSFSAWVYAETLDSTFQPIVAKGNYQYALQIRNTNEWEFFTYMDSAWQYTRSPSSPGSWKYIAGIRENDKQYLFVDGVLVNGNVSVMVEIPQLPDDTTKNVTIGCIPEMNRYFRGMIDEVRVMNCALSKDWIKLSYMNQKNTDELVEFK